MIKEIKFEDVIQLKFLNKVFFRELPMLQTCAYFVDGLLIDTGFEKSGKELVRILSKKNLRIVVNTHSHEDHSGGNWWIEKEFGIKAFAHKKAVNEILNPPADHYLSRKICWGVPKPAHTLPVPPVIETEKHRFVVIENTGHSDDHISLFEEKKGWLFGGDVFLSKRPKILRDDENPHLIIENLKTFSDLKANIYFCASGKVIENPREILLEKVLYLENMRYRILELNKKGVSHKKIRDEVLGKEELINFISKGKFSKMNFVKSFIKGF